MADPNIVYKESYRELAASLGRPPTTTELLPLHNEYARAWGPAEETLVAPKTTTVDLMAKLQASLAPISERLSATDKSPGPAEAVSAPAPPANKPGAAEGLVVGRRGPGGGVVAACVGCHVPFERPARRGRPPIRCEGCR